MSHRSKRETAPAPMPHSSSSAFVNRAPSASMKAAPAVRLTPPGESAASMRAAPGLTPPGASWWCGTPVPPQAAPSSAAMTWWSAANSSTAAAKSSSVQKDDVDPDLQEWVMERCNKGKLSCGGGAAASSSHLVPEAGIESNPNKWGVDNRPPGGFLSFFNNPWSPPHPQAIPPHVVPGMSVSGSHLRPQPSVNLENDEDDENGARIDVRLKWTKPEEVRLVIAWVNNSNNPINGNGKKTDRYWGDVTDEYNSTTLPNRRRTSKQLKDHFQKIKKKVTWFCSSWKEVVSIWPSGHSDDQILEKAEAIYEEYKDGPFPYKHCWKILCDEPKWQVLLEEEEQSNKRNLDTQGSVGELMPNLAQSEDRPMGNKKAKKEAKKEAKKCPSQIDDVLQKLTKIQGTDESREKMLETQKHVSSEKLESARLNHLAAKENAKSAMLETYRTLSMKDTSAMPDDVRVEHLVFMRCVRESIFSDANGSF